MGQGHTPGPWKASYHEPGNTVQGGLAGWSIQGSEGIAYNVAREGNARLIAAAPDLLEAVHSLLAVVTDPVTGEALMGCGDAVRDGITALEKAEGGAA